MTLKEQIMKLQTYKMYEGEDTVYVERDDVLKALEQQLRDCKTCKHSDKGNCAYTEECHECMWGSKYEQQTCEDWLQTFNTESATECYTAVQRLKEGVDESSD